MEYNNDKVDTDLTSYFWFEGENHISQWTVTADIYSAVFFYPYLEYSKVSYPQVRTNDSPFTFILQAS